MSTNDFIELYEVKNFYNYTLNAERCHNGSAPTLAQCVKSFGWDITANVMLPYLDLLISFTSAAKKPTPQQRTTICWLTCQHYGYLRITEWLLFISKCMAGEFGKWYNNIDPLDIMTAVRTWAAECQRIRNNYLAKQAENEQEEAYNTAPMSEEERARAVEMLRQSLARFKAQSKRND